MVMARINFPSELVRSMLLTSLMEKRSEHQIYSERVESAQRSLAEYVNLREKARSEVEELEKYLDENFSGWGLDTAPATAGEEEAVVVEGRVHRILSEGWSDQKILNWWITPNADLGDGNGSAPRERFFAGTSGRRDVLALAREIAEDFDDD